MQKRRSLTMMIISRAEEEGTLFPPHRWCNVQQIPSRKTWMLHGTASVSGGWSLLFSRGKMQDVITIEALSHVGGVESSMVSGKKSDIYIRVCEAWTYIEGYSSVCVCVCNGSRIYIYRQSLIRSWIQIHCLCMVGSDAV